MVKKLFKQELISYSRNLLPMFYILLGIAALNRVIQFFETGNFSYNVVFISSLIALIIASIVSVIMTAVVAIKRYYTNFFTNEGYLTFTLPATQHQLIITKLLCALLMTVASVTSCLIALIIATSGEVFGEIVKAFIYIAKVYFKDTHFNGALYILEAIILLITATTSAILLFYTCITVGQMAKKNRVAAAFAVYFGYYLLTQLLGTIFILVLPSISQNIPWSEISRWIVNHPFATFHIGFCALIIFYLVLCFLYYFITQLVIKRKLNLE